MLVSAQDLADYSTSASPSRIQVAQALGALSTTNRSQGGLVDRIATLRYSEGVLIGFLEALTLTDADAARLAAPRIEAYVGEAIAARILLDN